MKSGEMRSEQNEIDYVPQKKVEKGTDDQSDLRFSIDSQQTLNQMHFNAIKSMQKIGEHTSGEIIVTSQQLNQRQAINMTRFEFPSASKKNMQGVDLKKMKPQAENPWVENNEPPQNVTAYNDSSEPVNFRTHNSNQPESYHSVSRDNAQTPMSIVMRRSLRHRQKMI